MSPRLPRFGRGRRDDAEQPAASAPVDVPIRDEVIRLGQFLKLANLIDTGAEAKVVLAEGLVQVNGEPEARRGRQLRRGDVVELNGQAARVADEASADDLPW